MLVDHALARFSTDNLSVMIVRFDPQKLLANTSTDIGLETDPATQEKGAVSEVDMIVNEARRHSGLYETDSVPLSEVESDEAKQMAIKEEEEQEPGPELTPEGKPEADRILAEQHASLGTVPKSES